MELPNPIHKSHLSIAQICPWKANQILNQNVRNAETPQMLTGTNVHAALSTRLNHEDVDEANMTEEEFTLFQNGVEMLWGDSEILPNSSRYYSEITLQYPEENPFIKGTLDLVCLPRWDHSLCVVDFKTGWIKKKNQTEIDIYTLLAAKHFAEEDETPVVFYYYWLRDKTIWSYPIMESLTTIEARVKATIKKHEALPAIPIPGTHCITCQFVSNECPVSRGLSPSGDHLMSNFIKGGAVKTEDIPVIGLKLAAMDEIVKAAKEKFKMLIAASNPIPVGDYEWSINSYQKETYDKNDMKTLLLQYPIEEILPLVSINKSNLQKLKKENPTLCGKIAARLQPTKTINTLCFKKRKDEE